MLPAITPKAVKPVVFVGGPMDGFKTYLEVDEMVYNKTSDLEGYQHAYLRISDDGVGIFQYQGQTEVSNAQESV